MKAILSRERAASTKVDVLAAPDAPSILDPRWPVFARVADLGSLTTGCVGYPPCITAQRLPDTTSTTVVDFFTIIG
jgi:hypothetical protein